MKFILSSIPILVTLCSSLLPSLTEGHGYLKSPRSRQFYANQEGTWWTTTPGIPMKESEPQSSYTKAHNDVCGDIGPRDYDNFVDFLSNPMPWIPQAVYTEGQEFTVEVMLTANHWGHFEIHLCPNGNSSTQACMLQHPAEMIQDLVHNGPRDSAHPERGYVGSGSTGTFRFKYRLPPGVTGNNVMMQWRYVTANSCVPPGYRNNAELINRGWVNTGLPDCATPINYTGQGFPEQFFNCAEIQINPGGSPTPPTPTPTPPNPTPTNPTPTNPTPTFGTCGNGVIGNGVCSNGDCCSEWGWCGTTPDHCINNPPVPSPVATIPSCGNGSIGNGYCSNPNECCSEWGWCGTSPEHCINNCEDAGGSLPTGQNCAWVGRNPDFRCTLTDPNTGTNAWEACPITCGTCP